MNMFKKQLKLLALAIFLVGSLVVNIPSSAFATTQNPTPKAKVSFTFDDGLASAMTQAAPTLAKYGLTGTDYVTTGCVGMNYKPNTCHANTSNIYMTWDQVVALQNQYGWEIGSHSATHPYMATFNKQDGQKKPLTPEQVNYEITQSKADLLAHGINATDFSTPYGDYNNYTLQQIAKSYASHRGFADQNDNNWPYNEVVINDLQVQGGVTVATVKAKIDKAIANNQWLILTLHDIRTKASSNPDNYQYSTADLDKIAAYVKQKQDIGLINSITINKGTVSSDTNMLPNGSFNSGIGEGWTTDNPTNITADSGTNGSFPDATNAVKIVGGVSDEHLFSPQITVDPSTSYMFKTFLNVQTRAVGEVGFYIDEYDSSGNWISGQFKRAEPSQYVEELNYTYKPSSVLVAKASLQVYVTANSGITAYIDNAQMFALDASQQAPANLMTNGAFDSGITAGWHTDDATNIVADAGSHGGPNNPINSVALNASAIAGNAHLFSPVIAVDSTKTYGILSYLNITLRTSGEVGFYIDEYDANGSWVSGQYKKGVTSLGGKDISFSYHPTSGSVAKASLQIILVGQSGIHAYFDDVRWYLAT